MQARAKSLQDMDSTLIEYSSFMMADVCKPTMVVMSMTM